MIQLLPMRSENADATGYVATIPEEGLAQLEILKSLGCRPHHRVLEIGCGALVAGFPIMQYLDRGNYFGIEPNEWLTISSLKIPVVAQVATEKAPLFCPRVDFRSEPATKFDFIISHSILSHASNSQLDEFLIAATSQLADGGVIAASIRLAEGNEFGSPGSRIHGVAFKEWQYPGVSWFQQEDVLERTRVIGASARVAPELTQTILEGNPKAIHDWLVIRRTKVTLVTAFFRLSDRSVDEDEQFRQFERLADCGVPILLFLDVRFAERAPQHKNVLTILMGLDELWPFKQAYGRGLELPKHRTAEKDTREFLLLQNSKIDLLGQARKTDHLSTHFAWIDFGIMKIVKDENVFLKRLRSLRPPAKCVLAPGCWPPPGLLERELTDDVVHWRFCGGFLLADRNSIMDLIALDGTLLADPSSVTWEVNNWAKMERAGQHFDWYQADHDDSIIEIDRARPAPKIPRNPRVCLCMIVKNESVIIERCLAAALPFIDTWCIADTGSTDGTPEKIQSFFSRHGLPGHMVRTTFRDFAQARNEALVAARLENDWEYALLIDADMVLKGTLDRASLDAPAYSLKQYNGFLDYSNTRLVHRSAPAAYLGVTHEYLSVEGVQSLSTLTIDDRNDGGSKGDKGERDIRLLNQGLTDEPNNERYMFYLAQCYREMGRHHEAIQWYRRRIERGGWDEEIWASHYGIAHSYKSIGDEANFIKACLDAYDYRPSRGESLKLLAKHRRETGHNETAILFADALYAIPYPGDHLFVEQPVYDHGALQELAIAGYYSKIQLQRHRGYNACAKLTIHKDGGVREEARKNFTFYARPATDLFNAKIQPIDWGPDDHWAPMNPSVCVENLGPTEAGGPSHLKRLVLVRTVNYTVSDGQYPTIDGSGIIRTKNYVLEMNEIWKPIKATLIEDVTGIPRSNFPVEGFEDCRLWFDGSGYCVSATVRDFADSDGRCEMAICGLDDQWRVVVARTVRDHEREKTQKNWMPITGYPDDFLYLCDPTVVINTSVYTAELWRSSPPACLVDLRGGSQLISYEEGWLCITHEVAWRPERVYLHRFVRLDADFRIIAITDPFYFVHVGIEFCAGLARDGNRLVASFGVNDASAHLAFFDPSEVSAALIPL